MSLWSDYYDEGETCPNCKNVNCFRIETYCPSTDYPDSWGRNYPPYKIKVCKICGTEVHPQ